jgi:hypothetical protein
MKNHVLRWIRGMKTAGPNQLNSNEKQPTLSLQKVVEQLPVHYWLGREDDLSFISTGDLSIPADSGELPPASRPRQRRTQRAVQGR